MLIGGHRCGKSAPSAATARRVDVARSCTRTDARRAPTVSDTSREDRLRRFVQRDGPTEDLADRVKEIDLLVPLGEFVGRVFHFERRLQDTASRPARETRIKLVSDRCPVRRHGPSASHARPRPRDRRDQYFVMPPRRRLRPYRRRSGSGRRPGGWLVPAARAVGDRRRRSPTPAIHRAGLAFGRVVEAGEHAPEIVHARCSVMRTTLPRATSRHRRLGPSACA